MVDLKGLLTFVEVSERLSFANAARALGVPPSTVTTRINALEAELGVRLFNRTTRKTVLTHAGRDFSEHCTNALKEIELGKEKLLTDSEATGLVRISLPSAFPKHEFAAHIAAFRAKYPKIAIDVIFEDRLTDFVDDGVDIAIRGRAPGADNLFARELASTPVVCVAPCAVLNPNSLPLLTPLSNAENGAKSSRAVSTRSLEFSLELVISGQANAYLPLSICETALEQGKIMIISGPLEIQDPLKLYLVYHDRKYQPRRVMLLKRFLVEKLQSRSP